MSAGAESLISADYHPWVTPHVSSRPVTVVLWVSPPAREGRLPVQQSECSDVGVQPSGDVGCFNSAIAAKILPGSSSMIARCLGIEHVLSYADPKLSVTIITSVAGLARGLMSIFPQPGCNRPFIHVGKMSHFLPTSKSLFESSRPSHTCKANKINHLRDILSAVRLSRCPPNHLGLVGPHCRLLKNEPCVRSAEPPRRTRNTRRRWFPSIQSRHRR
jgi:hypothetical protein